MNTEFSKFLEDHKVSANESVTQMMTLDDDEFSSKKITIGGFIRKLSLKSTQNGGTSLPSEYFGVNSKSYFSNVPSINYNDASPQLTRPALNQTFAGGKYIKNPKKYKFVLVKYLKKYFRTANKQDAENINALITRVLTSSIKERKLSKESLLKQLKKCV